ncbi:MAG: tRNA dihydrouridine synthase DusB [bacterium]|nr:MAG: tRNA dihydrouridine synthase DusB [bacterium]
MMARGDQTNLFEDARVCFAPMAGYSDAPARLLCFEFGADFAYTEMVSAEGLVRRGEKTICLLERMDGEGPVGVQLFGADAGVLAEAAAIVTGTSPAFIDLNFGCPVKKVIRRNGGAAIMRDLGLMGRICRAVVRSTDLPVTAKIRSGWSPAEENFMEAGRVIQDAGVAAVAIHPRFRTQGFSGVANWEHIARLRAGLSIPVIANGDVQDATDYLAMVQTTGCRIVMIGRGAYGRPWIFKEIKDALDGRISGRVGIGSRIDVLERHLRMEVEWKGERLGTVEMRKHYGWYLKGMPGIKRYRRELTSAGSLEELVRILVELREGFDGTWKKLA